MLKAERIADLLKKGENPENPDPFVISPQPKLSKLKESGSASVDLRLGTWFATLRHIRIPYLKADSDNVPENQICKMHYVSFNSEFILHPGNFALGITLEWLRIPANLAGDLVGKSSWGRKGLIIATAVRVQPGSTGCLTLELCNMGEVPIALRPGMTICQLGLWTTEPNDSKTLGQSRFFAQRTPSLGTTEVDTVVDQLREHHK